MEIPRGNTGLYTLIVYAVDSEGRVSNHVRGLIDYQLGAGSPPEIIAIEGPDVITPPTQLTLVAVVTDPDDAGNFYLFVSGTSSVRKGEELEGCSDTPTDDETALFSIDALLVDDG